MVSSKLTRWLSCWIAFPCTLVDCEGGFLAKATICDVMNHYWAGFKVNELLDGKCFGYVSVYFSHNGTWNNIYKSTWSPPFSTFSFPSLLGLMRYCDNFAHWFFVDCIQPQLSGDTIISAGGMDYVTIKCVRQLNCSNTEPQTIIMTLDESICSDYSEPKCCKLTHSLAHTFKRVESNNSTD